MNITIGFLNYNSSNYIKKQIALDYFQMSKDIVNEIVIQDDCSSIEDFEELKKLQNSKIKIFQNKKNIKPLLGRIELLKNCTNDWVLLMDSDNFLDSNSFEALFKNFDPSNTNVIHCADYARPEFNYKYMSGKVINFPTAKYYAPRIACFLNTGNYLVPKNNYLKVSEQIDNSFAEHTLEVMYFSYLWLKNGNLLKCVNGFEYDHTMRDDCYSKTNDMSFNQTFHRIITLFNS